MVTGGAAGEITAARQLGIDTFITGEGAHHNYFDASEGGINLYFGGHYATEVWGVRADFRQYHTGHPFEFPNESGMLRQTEITFGISFNF